MKQSGFIVLLTCYGGAAFCLALLAHVHNGKFSGDYGGFAQETLETRRPRAKTTVEFK